MNPAESAWLDGSSTSQAPTTGIIRVIRRSKTKAYLLPNRAGLRSLTSTGRAKSQDVRSGCRRLTSAGITQLCPLVLRCLRDITQSRRTALSAMEPWPTQAISGLRLVQDVHSARI